MVHSAQMQRIAPMLITCCCPVSSGGTMLLIALCGKGEVFPVVSHCFCWSSTVICFSFNYRSERKACFEELCVCVFVQDSHLNLPLLIEPNCMTVENEKDINCHTVYHYGLCQTLFVY